MADAGGMRNYRLPYLQQYSADKARAARLSQVRNVAVVTAHPIRQTIVPSLSFSGSLDPEWQAEVAAKVDGRLERFMSVKATV